MAEPERPVFCGNFEYDASEKDIAKLFEKYGLVERIDMKTGFAFVYMKNKRDAEDAIYYLDRKEWGFRKVRPLRVEWAKSSDGGTKKNQAPTTTLFVVNFDVMRTRERDLDDYFSRFGPLERVEIKRNYAFIEFRNLDDATEAQRRAHTATFNGRTITVEFVQSDGEKRGGDRDRSRSPYGRAPRRSPPDYGRARSPARGPSPGRSPARNYSPPRRRERSPDYNDGGYRRSASPY